MIAAKLLAVAFIASASSFTLQVGLQDGFYRAYVDENGGEAHELLNSTLTPRSDTAAAKAPLAIEKRFGTGTLQSWCGCGFDLDHGDCDAAVTDIKNRVNIPGADGDFIPWGEAYYSIRGSVVAFACDTDDSEETSHGPLPGVSMWNTSLKPKLISRLNAAGMLPGPCFISIGAFRQRTSCPSLVTCNITMVSISAAML